MNAHLILGNQLFANHPSLSSSKDEPKIFIESIKTSNKYKYHKLKLVYVFSTMRHYAEELRSKGHEVIYITQSEKSIRDELKIIISSKKIKHISYMIPVDNGPRENLKKFFSENNVEVKIFENMLHITNEANFDDWKIKSKKPIMEFFYRDQRKKLNILMDKDKPEGGIWNYDKENRKPLPKNLNDFPKIPKFEIDEITHKAIRDVSKNFSSNPGDIDNIWLPVNHEQSKIFLDDFIENRLTLFGKYEDAIKNDEAILFHSGLSALINNGLLEVREVLDAVIEAKDIPISSKEGFIRQIIGWREYMYGIYLSSPDLINLNYFGFKKELEPYWFTLDFEDKKLPEAVKNSLKTLKKYSYNHHIERLMVLGNWFLLNEYNPKSVNDWFMSMYVDAYEWVMVPNVIGMSQYADGGSVATKPYISGDSYLQKMGHYIPSKDEELSYTYKYWKFLDNNYDKLKGNPRMSLALSLSAKRKI